ncbi:replication factor C large subunit [Candidatus Micrarchaeota archaeon]|nr:MAG: replication factor C large subunit [Candidatus Micrarchaeota archaeon]
MWVEKYRPKNLDDVIGYPSVVEKLRIWADNWEKGRPQKALLFSGRPGIGKTAIALALASEYNWEVLEMNASDIRDKKSIERIAGLASVSRTFSGNLRLLLFDEIDGLYAADRGGASAVLNIIKTAKCPVILTANNAWDRKIANLRPAVEIISFKKIHHSSIKKLLQKIVKKEGLNIPDTVISFIAENAEGDVRSAINDLESIAFSKHFDKEVLESIAKRNRQEDIFNAMKKILKEKNYFESISVVDELSEDPSMLMAWIEENIPAEYKRAEDLFRAFDILSRADLFFGRTLSRQDYSLWRYAITLMTAGVSYAKKEKYPGFTRYNFPKKISYLSASKKQRNILKSIALKVAKRCHLSSKKVILEYMPLIKVLAKKEAVKVAAQFELSDEELSYLGVKDSKKVVKEANALREEYIKKLVA